MSDPRIGDPERNHARWVLDEAFRLGYIASGEYQQRHEALSSAERASDLPPIIGDLGLVEATAAASQDNAPFDPDTGLARGYDYHEHEWVDARPAAYRIMDTIDAFWSVVGVVVFLAIIVGICTLVGSCD